MRVDLLGQTGTADAEEISYQLTQNWYPHIEPEGKSKLALLPTPGLTEFANTNNGVIRGQINYNGIFYVVSGNGFYEINSSGTHVNRGTLKTSSGRCMLAHNGANNGQQIAIADGLHFYIWDSSGLDFKVITDSGDPDYDADCPAGPTHVIFIDGFFLINDPANSGRFYKSASYDGTAWDATEFATAEQVSDELNAIIASNSQIIYLIGETSTETWVNSGATDFPFEPAQSGYIPYGTIAPYSPAELDGIVFWLTQSESGQGLVVMASGYDAKIISTPAITSEIADLSTLDDAYGWTYQYKQHAFYVLTFPSGGKTFVYDVTTGKWHQWASKTLNYHRSAAHTFVYNKHLVGDPASGKVYYLDWSKWTDNGDTITRIRRSAHIHGEDKPVRHYALYAETRMGVGNSDITDPQIMMRYRDSNGAWSNERSRSLGKVGEKDKKAVWRQLGRSVDRVYELKVTDPCDAVLLDCYLRIDIDSRELE